MRQINSILNDIKDNNLKEEISTSLIHTCINLGNLVQCEKCGNIHNKYFVCNECGWDKSVGEYITFKEGICNES